MNKYLPQGSENAAAYLEMLHQNSEEAFIANGQKRTLALFHSMAERVPAYKDFLSKNEIDHTTIVSPEDLKRVPTVDKQNYLTKYSREQLCWDGQFGKGSWVISTTSGSTGKPFYFPRQSLQDEQYALTAELYLRQNFKIHERKTLYIVAFPMGAWIGGLYTYEALKIISERGNYDLSIITPGIHKQEVINAVLQLGSSYDQIIIGAYAPFLKDILDDGQRQGINWADHNMGFIFSAEAFSEKFRDYTLKMVNAGNEFTSTLNHYGTVDLGTMAHETPESILIRRDLVSAGKLKNIFLEEERQPTLCQYDPDMFYFEEQEGNLICSSSSGIPLVRYDLKDYGGVLTRKQLHLKLKDAGINIEARLNETDLSDTTWNLPFVYVYERNDFSVSYYAFLVYPDMIRRALQNDAFEDLLTGKFAMLVDYDNLGRQKLNIHVEKKFDVEDGVLAVEIAANIHEKLLSESSEYRETFSQVGQDVKPVVHLWNYEDKTYFKPGTKQKWVVK